MGTPYQRAVMVLLPQNVSVLISSKVIRPIIQFSSPPSNDGRHEGKMLRKVASSSTQVADAGIELNLPRPSPDAIR